MKYPTNKLGREGFTDAAGCEKIRGSDTLLACMMAANRISFPIASLSEQAAWCLTTQAAPKGGIFL